MKKTFLYPLIWALSHSLITFSYSLVSLKALGIISFIRLLGFCPRESSSRACLLYLFTDRAVKARGAVPAGTGASKGKNREGKFWLNIRRSFITGVSHGLLYFGR